MPVPLGIFSGVVKFFTRLELEQIISFVDRNYIVRETPYAYKLIGAKSFRIRLKNAFRRILFLSYFNRLQLTSILHPGTSIRFHTRVACYTRTDSDRLKQQNRILISKAFPVCAYTWLLLRFLMHRLRFHPLQALDSQPDVFLHDLLTG